MLKQIQRHIGVKADGIIGPKTLEAIADALGIAAPEQDSDFPNILAKVLVHEGGYVNHPKDPGGATNKGITQRTYDAWRSKNVLPIQSVRNILTGEVQAIYKQDYWDAVRGDDLPDGVNYAVFDFAVNSGINRASRYLQAVVGANQDGKIGPETIAKTKALPPASVIDALCDRRMTFLKGLSHWPTFGKGWTRRVEAVRKDAKGMIA